MLDKRCEPQMWQHQWDANNQRPSWEDLTDDYKRFIQYQQAYPGEAVAREWWNTRLLREKREYFLSPQQMKGMQCGNPYIVSGH